MGDQLWLGCRNSFQLGAEATLIAFAVEFEVVLTKDGLLNSAVGLGVYSLGTE